MTLPNMLLVGAGSCLGGMLRYMLGSIIQIHTHGPFPWGTLGVNLAGCLALGFICGMIDNGCHLGQGMRLFLTVGLCGGFTTFSTFVNETHLLCDHRQQLTAIAYATASLAGGITMLYVGHTAARLATTP